jgi:hypothetical protein
MPIVAESTGEENANLYKRGVNEGSSGDLLDAHELLELLDVFGEAPTAWRHLVSKETRVSEKSSSRQLGE